MSTINRLIHHRAFMAMLLSGSLSIVNLNIVRNAIALMITYRIFASNEQAFMWGSIFGGLYLMPWFLFSTLGGELADKTSKAHLFQMTRLLQLPLALATAYLFIYDPHNVYLLAFTVLLTATNDAIFSPIRYAILPDYLSKHQLLSANAILESSVLISITIGMGLSFLILQPHGAYYTSVLTLALAGTAYFFSLLIPYQAARDNSPLQLHWNFLLSLQRNIDETRKNDVLWQSILGLSWFWFVGYNLMLQFSNYVKFDLLCDGSVVLLFNLCYTLGLASGSFACQTLLKNRVDSRLTPLALFGIGAFGLHMWGGSIAFGTEKDLMDIWGFLSQASAWRLLLDVYLMTFCGGVLIVPLYAILQRASRQEKRARVIACMNVVTSLGMVLASVLQMMTITALGIPFIHYVGLIFLCNIFISIYAIRVVPFDVMRKLFARVLRAIFRIEITGLEHFSSASSRLLVVSNHISYLDVPLLAVLIPRHVMFAMDTEVAKWLIVRMISPLTHTFAINPKSSFATKSMIQKIRTGRTCVIFPEGGLSRTGKIMKVYEGTAMIAEHANADIIAINIGGVENNVFTPHTQDMMRTAWFPKIRVTISKPFKLQHSGELRGRAKRAYYTQMIYQELVQQYYQNKTRHHIIEELYRAKSLFGSKKTIVQDITGKSLTYRSLLTKAHVLGQAMQKSAAQQTRIGLFLPNTLAHVVSFFGCQIHGMIPAILNYSAGITNILSACQTGDLRVVFTAHAFIEKAHLQDVIDAMKEAKIQIVYLEDIAKTISITDKLTGVMRSIIWPYVPRESISPEAPAMILFTSGSEGKPKGVVLSHKNIMANVRQIESVIDLTPHDRLFNPLPMFHALGMNVGTITPIMSGVFTYLYPNPKHFSIIPEIIYERQMTIMLGTNTFINAYGRNAHPYDFRTVRLAVAGGEKLSDETRKMYAENFGIRIIEGYGSTECAPVVSCNTPIYHQSGSVGQLLPGLQMQLLPFEQREDAYALSVKGDNVMLGYLLHDKPGQLQTVPEGWYATGDVITLDHYGYLTIVDRIKRFAKVGGEMISLSQVENIIQSCWPEYNHGLITVKDAKRGEKIILLTTCPNADRSQLRQAFSLEGLSNLALPSVVEFMKTIPLLGSGKVDYVKLKAIFQDLQEVSTEESPEEIV